MENSTLHSQWSTLIGATLGPGEWFEISQQRIDAFADATLDHQSIHVDPDHTNTIELGGTIAHGFLSLSMLSYLSKALFDPYLDGNVVLNYGLNKLRFITPVPASAEIRLSIRIVNAEVKSQGVLVCYESVVDINQKDKPAIVAEQLALILE